MAQQIKEMSTSHANLQHRGGKKKQNKNASLFLPSDRPSCHSHSACFPCLLCVRGFLLFMEAKFGRAPPNLIAPKQTKGQ